MLTFHRLVFFLFLLLFSVACNHRLSEQKDALSEKCGPYDLFAFQRSYPDPDFDWKGWRNAMETVRLKEKRGVQERGSTGCDNNATNWTLQGPANVAGRVNALAVHPNDELTVLAGFAGGGIFKTIDGGVNWYPVFDDQPELAIGDITYDPVNPNIVYAGTGDVNIPSIVFNGNGVYKSIDGGEHWQYSGLSEAGIISKIQVDPLNPQILYAGAMGNPYIRDNQRGIYKSTDGGQHWQQVLLVSNQAGASDLLINPSNPQILYASFWDRIRSNTESVIYGPNARIYKTTDGGANWTQLGGGLPNGIMGRTGLVMSLQNPDKIYAVYVDTLSKPGGIYKTTNGGASWTSVSIASLTNAYSDFGWYFGKLRISPTNDEEIYLLGVLLWKRVPVSGIWQNAAGGHSDSHDFVLLPSGRRYWANDGGVYRSAPGVSNFTKCVNLPTTQIYHTDFNSNKPNTYYIGAQDNGIQKGSGAAINNWSALFFADGFNCVFTPGDSSTFWVETQNGAVHKTSDGGANWIQGSETFDTGDRTNWDAPFFMSAHNPPKRFAGTYRVHSTTNDFWDPISGDLTDGNIYGARYHNISALNESPVLAEKLLAGTSDGNVWRREPAGTWVKINNGLPDRYVTSVHGSTVAADRIFVTQSGFRDNEVIPHVHRSDNNGQSWVNISGDLPQLPVNDLFIMPGQSDNVLFVGNDAGVYFTLNGGQHWARLGANMPYIAVFDLEHNPVRKELMAATFARGLWTFPLDSVFSQQSPTVTLSGSIQTETGAGVSDVQVREQPLTKTTSDGLFSIPAVPGCQQFRLQPKRNDNPLNGLSTYDLVLMSKHILSIEVLGSPYKLIAADANRSGSITTFDVVVLRKLILGIDTAFSNNTSWRFIPADFVFPNPLNPFQTALPDSIAVDLQTASVGNLNMIAIKTGDVNNTVIPFSNTDGDERFIDSWPLAYIDRTVKPGETIELIFSGAAAQLAALQMSLQFDPDALEFLSVKPLLEGISLDHFATNRAQNGLLSLACEQLKTQQTGVLPLFQLRFRARTSGRLSDLIQLAENPTKSIAYRADGAALKPVFASGTNPDAGNLLFPNPSRIGEAVSIRLELPAGKEVVLELFDGQGLRCYTEQLRVSDQGTVVVSGRAFDKPGVYFCSVKYLDKMVFGGKIVQW